jgi:hypothetical protein
VRITHKPTGLVVSMQDEKSQLQNRDKALRVLRARLLERRIAEQHAELAADRRAQVGIIGGQVALFGSVALFVYDLRHARGPGNIPYPSGAPEGAAREASARRSVAAGLRLAF